MVQQLNTSGKQLYYLFGKMFTKTEYRKSIKKLSINNLAEYLFDNNPAIRKIAEHIIKCIKESNEEDKTKIS